MEVLIAEDKGHMIGFIGIYKYDKNEYGASILIDESYRNKGLGKQLCDEIFKKIPNNIEVEAWVADINEHSLKATPKMGFRFKNQFRDEELGFNIYVFTRNGEKQTKSSCI